MQWLKVCEPGMGGFRLINLDHVEKVDYRDERIVVHSLVNDDPSVYSVQDVVEVIVDCAEMNYLLAEADDD